MSHAVRGLSGMLGVLGRADEHKYLPKWEDGSTERLVRVVLFLQKRDRSLSENFLIVQTK